ncbi:MAG TPA: menaquinone biosynthesis protein [Longimicrobiaceae bacterium]
MGEATERQTVGELRLGDIIYSNCFPVHARLIDRPREGDPKLVPGPPSLLNRLLSEREIDVAPSSSIEYARNADRYRILPDLVIGSKGPVRSILFLSRYNPSRLDGRVVALPTASATSVVLLKILLHLRWGTAPTFTWFDQSSENPFVTGADAALFIGDVALRPGLHERILYRYDLGEVWYTATGLPFAFAVWQASGGTPEQLACLQEMLVASREYFEENHARLARDYSEHFGLPRRLLDEYWRGLIYRLDEPMQEGLRSFYRLAVQIGELEVAPDLAWA